MTNTTDINKINIVNCKNYNRLLKFAFDSVSSFQQQINEMLKPNFKWNDSEPLRIHNNDNLRQTIDNMQLHIEENFVCRKASDKWDGIFKFNIQIGEKTETIRSPGLFGEYRLVWRSLRRRFQNSHTR